MTALGLCSLATVGGTSLGDETSGALIALGGLYAAAVLAVRTRAWRRSATRAAGQPRPGRLVAHRVF